jgi:hypothetical protein
MMLVADELEPFRELVPRSPRMRRLCWTPYVTDGILAAAGGLMNSLGLFYVIASALPSTLGANAGLLSLPGLIPRWRPVPKGEPVGAIERSPGWIAAGFLAALVFIFVLGRGLTLSR